MKLMNQLVIHKKFGQGKVIEQNSNYLTISFSIGDKKFLFPESFESFLKVKNPEIADQIAKLLIKNSITKGIEVVVEAVDDKETKTINWGSTWKQMGAEIFRGLKDGSKPPCPEFKIFSSKSQSIIFNLKNLFEVILNTEERVLILTFWIPEYPGSTTEGYEYMAVNYDKSGDIILSTPIFFKNSDDKVKIKRAKWAKVQAIKLLKENSCDN